MLNLEKLFKNRPFIYLINDVYYAFGTNVCTKCEKEGRYMLLSSKYQSYIDAQKDDSISQKDAWEIYRKLTFDAELVAHNAEHTHLFEQFEEMNFSNADKSEIESQLKNLMVFLKNIILKLLQLIISFIKKHNCQIETIVS